MVDVVEEVVLDNSAARRQITTCIDAISEAFDQLNFVSFSILTQLPHVSYNNPDIHTIYTGKTDIHNPQSSSFTTRHLRPPEYIAPESNPMEVT